MSLIFALILIVLARMLSDLIDGIPNVWGMGFGLPTWLLGAVLVGLVAWLIGEPSG